MQAWQKTKARFRGLFIDDEYDCNEMKKGQPKLPFDLSVAK
jgi:hypothetical protein